MTFSARFAACVIDMMGCFNRQLKGQGGFQNGNLNRGETRGNEGIMIPKK